MFGFGKKKYQIIVMHGKDKQVVGEEDDQQKAISHVKRLRNEHKMAVYKKV